MSFTVSVNNVLLPEGVVSLKRGDELLWSDGTGRGAANGMLVGTVIAAKRTYSVEWGVLTDAEYTNLRNAIPNGFFPFVVTADGATIASITAYRGAISGKMLSALDGVYWKDVSVDFIER